MKSVWGQRQGSAFGPPASPPALPASVECSALKELFLPGNQVPVLFVSVPLGAGLAALSIRRSALGTSRDVPSLGPRGQGSRGRALRASLGDADLEPKRPPCAHRWQREHPGGWRPAGCEQGTECLLGFSLPQLPPPLQLSGFSRSSPSRVPKTEAAAGSACLAEVGEAKGRCAGQRGKWLRSGPEAGRSAEQGLPGRRGAGGQGHGPLVGAGGGLSLTGVGAHRGPASSLSVSSVWGLDAFSAEEGGAGRRVLRAWQQHKIVSSCSVGPEGSLTLHWCRLVSKPPWHLEVLVLLELIFRLVVVSISQSLLSCVYGWGSDPVLELSGPVLTVLCSVHTGGGICGMSSSWRVTGSGCAGVSTPGHHMALVSVHFLARPVHLGLADSSSGFRGTARRPEAEGTSMGIINWSASRSLWGLETTKGVLLLKRPVESSRTGS
ncbi:uncharacterized protein LOC125128732 [Phacochoerus africanus]|uniref:uncharacterized protein LOC125128732 n=1 Tax=Phacochoerus africanus TaxID=41426 RepID=UPI001FD9F70F|nr:uncharacterized protein LOC125128732 [Phacochoerus africanus]